MSRIRDLPKRDWLTGAIERAEEMTALLRQPHGTMTLRPVQGVALWEAYTCGGLFANIRVGGGKTLLSGLLAAVVPCDRPIILVPGALLDKTRKELDLLRLHWRIPKNIRIVSYSKLGLVKSLELLDAYRPDLVIADEAHKLKNYRKAACARRVARYLEGNPDCNVAILGATLMKDSFNDYSHLLQWSLKELAPVPLVRDVAEQWAAGLDANTTERPDYAIFSSALASVDDPQEARLAFQERLNSAPGVIITKDGYDERKLEVNAIVVDPPPAVQEHFDALRELWINPDGWPLADAKFQVWAVARKLARGLYRYHTPWPPADWWEARKAWCSFVRKAIELDVGYDSELAVWQACESGRLKSLGVWEEWQELGPTFTPNRETEWISDFAVQACVQWGKKHNGIILSESIEFGREVARVGDWEYFGAGGMTDAGLAIEDSSMKQRPGVASFAANYTGRNLQHNWNRMLLVEPPANALAWEQVLGRPHREEQERDVVVDYMVSCIEDIDAVRKSVMLAQQNLEQSGQSQKLIDWPVEMAENPNTGPSWVHTAKQKDE